MTSLLDVTDNAEVSQLLTVGPDFTATYQTDLTTKKVVESVNQRNVYRRNFNSLSFGSQSVTFQIENRDVIKLLSVHMKIANPLPADTYVNRGFGIQAIKEVRFDFGASESLTYNTAQLWMMLMAECETDDKRLELLRQCGEKRDSSDSGEVSCHVPIPLPWSSVMYRGAEYMAGFDSRTINSNINVSITLNDANCVFGGSSSSYPASLQEGYFQLETQELYRPQDQLIRQNLLSNPLSSYNFRFLYFANNNVGRFRGSVDKCNKVQLDLQGFRHGNLVSVYLLIRKVSDVVGDVNGVKNPLQWAKMRNIQADFNGVPFHVSDSDGGDLECLSQSYAGGCYAPYDYVPPGQPSSPYTSIPSRSHYVHFRLSPLAQKAFSEYVQSGKDMGGNIMNLSFNTDSEDDFEMIACYVYQTHAVISNSAAKIRFTLK